MIKRFVQCVACRSFRTENGEDVARRVSQLEAENARLHKSNEKLREALTFFVSVFDHTPGKNTPTIGHALDVASYTLEEY